LRLAIAGRVHRNISGFSGDMAAPPPPRRAQKPEKWHRVDGDLPGGDGPWILTLGFDALGSTGEELLPQLLELLI
jgi:hypothetical protein